LKDHIEKFAKILQRELPTLKSQYHVATLEVFGSFVRGEQTETSDLDVLVSFTQAPSLFQFLELEDYLSELLGIKVDLVMRNALKPNIGRRIRSEAQSIR